MNAIVNMAIKYLTNGIVPIGDIGLCPTFILFTAPPTHEKDRYARNVGRTRAKIP